MKKNKAISSTVTVTRTIRGIAIISLVLVFIAALASSCGPSIKVTSDYDRSVNFTAYKTFSMYEMKSENVNQLNQDRIERYIRAEMTKRGFTETKENPDLLVNAMTVMKNKKGISASTSFYGGYGFYRPYGVWGVPAAGYTSVSTYDYKDGSLVIDLIDAKVKKMIWTGAASAEVYNAPKNPEEAIGVTVAKIMANFPVGSSAPTAKK